MHLFRRGFIATVATISVLGMIGCGKDDGGGSAGDSVPAEEAAIDQALELQGSWASNCRDANLFGLSENSQIEVTGFNIAQSTQFHSRGNCEEPSVLVSQTASFAKQGETEAGISKIDISVTQIRVKPVTETGVAILKLANFCGISKWELNREVDVTSRTGTERCFPKVPNTIYQIYSIEQGRLIFGDGDTDSMFVPSNRPQELNRDEYFTKR